MSWYNEAIFYHIYPLGLTGAPKHNDYSAPVSRLNTLLDVYKRQDEGGFAPALKSDEEAIETILEAVKKAGYEPGKDFRIAMDAASSEWKSEKGKGYYKLPKAGTEYTSEELIEHWAKLCEKYPIISIEDGLDEEDWEGWQKLTARLGDKVQLVGDDLFVTNTERPVSYTHLDVYKRQGKDIAEGKGVLMRGI